MPRTCYMKQNCSYLYSLFHTAHKVLRMCRRLHLLLYSSKTEQLKESAELSTSLISLSLAPTTKSRTLFSLETLFTKSLFDETMKPFSFQLETIETVKDQDHLKTLLRPHNNMSWCRIDQRKWSITRRTVPPTVEKRLTRNIFPSSETDILVEQRFVI